MAKAPLTRLRLALTEAVRILRHGTTDGHIRSVLDIADVMTEIRTDRLTAEARAEGFQAGMKWAQDGNRAAPAVLPRPRRHLALADATGPTTAITEVAAAR